MSLAGTVQDILGPYQRGAGEPHRHGWTEECERCAADQDEWDVFQRLLDVAGPDYLEARAREMRQEHTVRQAAPSG